MNLLTIFWVILIGSLIFACFFLLLGDVFDSVMDGFFHPLLLFGTLAVISGTGIILTMYTHLSVGIVLGIGLGLGIMTYILIYNFIIIPISHAETSSSHSAQDYQGRIAEVITTIPANGYGEVLIASPTGSSSETARSFDGIDILGGMKVVVVEVDSQGVCSVSPLEDDLI